MVKERKKEIYCTSHLTIHSTQRRENKTLRENHYKSKKQSKQTKLKRKKKYHEIVYSIRNIDKRLGPVVFKRKKLQKLF